MGPEDSPRPLGAGGVDDIGAVEQHAIRRGVGSVFAAVEWSGSVRQELRGWFEGGDQDSSFSE